MNKMRKEILRRLEEIVDYETEKLPKKEEAYITSCSFCGAILTNTKLVSGESLVFFGGNGVAHGTLRFMMCINCKFVNEQKIIINDEKLRQIEKLS